MIRLEIYKEIPGLHKEEDRDRSQLFQMQMDATGVGRAFGLCLLFKPTHPVLIHPIVSAKRYERSPIILKGVVRFRHPSPDYR